MHRRVGVVEAMLAAALVVAGAGLRWWHLGTPSLWWDELVHVRTAEQPSIPDVWRAVRDGSAPGSGNAGAVPLDYLALHAWLATTPAPSPATFERHARIPAFAFAAAALPLVWWLGRAVAGPAAGLTALALTATSLPHVLYAAEARFYSLYVLTTLTSLFAFAALVAQPTVARGVAFALANAVFVLAALYGVFPIAAEHAVLAVLAWRRRGTVPGRVLAATTALGGMGALGFLALWLSPSAITTVHPRVAQDGLHALGAVRDTFAFLAGGDQALATVLALGLLLAPVVAARAPARALAWTSVVSLAAIAAIVALARWKHYYYHPRHALFLLPMCHLGVALVVDRLAALAGRPAAGAGAAIAALVALSAPTLAAYVADPIPFFQATKTLRDFRGLMAALDARTRALAPGARYLLVVEKRKPGHLANPLVAAYLGAHGLDTRVMLVGVGDPAPLLSRLDETCDRACDAPLDVAFLAWLGLRDPFDQLPAVRRLLAMTAPPPSPRVAGIGVVAWAPNAPARTPPGLVATRLDGLVLYEPAGR